MPDFITVDFTKMHGLGNDYLFIDCIDRTFPDLDWPQLARLMSQRRVGVGSDGIILILPSDKHDFRMRIFNKDGSEAEMCGNGIRCFARYVYEHGLTQKVKMDVETLAGTVIPEVVLSESDGSILAVTVDMGSPRLNVSRIPAIASLLPKSPSQKRSEERLDDNVPVIENDWVINGRSVKATLVSMGNPHCVIFWPGCTRDDVFRVGPELENHPAFPERVNVEFVDFMDASNIRVMVWERGSGFTEACGTGACAAVVACILGRRTSRSVEVFLPGGRLHVNWRENGPVYMTGPAEEVFTGRYKAKCDSICSSSI